MIKKLQYYKEGVLKLHQNVSISNLYSYRFEDIWISWIVDNHGGDGVEFTESGSEFNIVSFEVVDIGFSKHCVVFKLGLSDGWAIVSDQDQLGLSHSESSDGVLVSYNLKYNVNQNEKMYIYLPILNFPDLTTKLSLALMF